MVLICPRHFQERVTRAGGTNRYGEPNFRLAWSQDETFRAGGVWPDDHYAGYREVYAATCAPFPPVDGYWMLMEWTPPEQYGGEGQYFFLHRDEATGLSSLGPYPHRGRYQLAAKLIWTIVEAGRLLIEPWSLTSAVIDRIIPCIVQSRNDSLKKRLEFARAEKIQTERKLDSQIEAVRKDAKRPLLLPSRIEDRIRLMEKQWVEYLRNPMKTGFQQA